MFRFEGFIRMFRGAVVCIHILLYLATLRLKGTTEIIRNSQAAVAMKLQVAALRNLTNRYDAIPKEMLLSGKPPSRTGKPKVIGFAKRLEKFNSLENKVNQKGEDE